MKLLLIVLTMAAISLTSSTAHAKNIKINGMKVQTCASAKYQKYQTAYKVTFKGMVKAFKRMKKGNISPNYDDDSFEEVRYYKSGTCTFRGGFFKTMAVLGSSVNSIAFTEAFGEGFDAELVWPYNHKTPTLFITLTNVDTANIDFSHTKATDNKKRTYRLFPSDKSILKDIGIASGTSCSGSHCYSYSSARTFETAVQSVSFVVPSEIYSEVFQEGLTFRVYGGKHSQRKPYHVPAGWLKGFWNAINDHRKQHDYPYIETNSK